MYISFKFIKDMCSLEELNPKRGIQDGQKYLTVPKYFPALNLINAVWLKDTAQHSGCCKKIQLVEQDVLKSSPTAVSQAVVMILLVFFCLLCLCRQAPDSFTEASGRITLELHNSSNILTLNTFTLAFGD